MGGLAQPQLPQARERVDAKVGSYAQQYYLKLPEKLTMTETVRRWRDFTPYLPLPHPSWRNTGWLRKNPWFEEELLPQLQQQVHELIG